MPQLDRRPRCGHNAVVTTRIGFLGGTGIEGRGLALRFALAGAEVAVGSRSEERARAAAAEYNTLLGHDLIHGAANDEMLRSAEIVFLTLPFDSAAEAVERIAADLPAGVVLVDVTVPIRFDEGRPDYFEPPEGSNAERIAARLPRGARHGRPPGSARLRRLRLRRLGRSQGKGDGGRAPHPLAPPARRRTAAGRANARADDGPGHCAQPPLQAKRGALPGPGVVRKR
ncbi:MAG: hypothetical protein DMG07_22975 [Acidobacteria bacterium]|nr:MAG: hypothetical protein DMG07_22975 [Acidobacteriota bacterium]